MFSQGVRFMLLATFFFALMNAAVKLLGHLPAIEIAFLRSVVSLTLAYAIVKVNGIHLPGNNRRALLLRGLFGSSSLVLYFITLQHMPWQAPLHCNTFHPSSPRSWESLW